ncbi:cell division protein SepF [Thermophilibacter provencensis]|uniref:Cell division protein SepF n=1 Tax=Thermophilibacter provencensis TaxID=1852386 RepID=A0ABT7V450_9ACTN|nr:cell division protein SepF [Thermophilibacter provencensis]MDM8271366.1 cell division protein SepF [Thermophilibacter provencensis]
MSFLDTIKDKLHGIAGDDYYEDDYYEEGYEDEGYDRGASSRRRDPGSSPRLLGTTPRPEAESVSVYTRSGRPVSAERTQQTAPVSPRAYAETPAAEAYESATGRIPTPGDLGPRTISRISSSQLPPYVLKPVSYDDVQTVVRRVRTNQPVVVVFRNTNIETAKRILDFCFGFSYGVGGEIEELGDRVFAVLPAGASLSKADIDKLVADGDLVR